MNKETSLKLSTGFSPLIHNVDKQISVNAFGSREVQFNLLMKNGPWACFVYNHLFTGRHLPALYIERVQTIISQTEGGRLRRSNLVIERSCHKQGPLSIFLYTCISDFGSE